MVVESGSFDVADGRLQMMNVGGVSADHVIGDAVQPCWRDWSFAPMQSLYIATAKRMKADGRTGKDIAKYLGVCDVVPHLGDSGGALTN